jgi:hypothetical protein
MPHTTGTGEAFSQISEDNSWFVDKTNNEESLMYICMLVSLLVDKLDTDVKAARARNLAQSRDR